MLGRYLGNPPHTLLDMVYARTFALKNPQPTPLDMVYVRI